MNLIAQATDPIAIITTGDNFYPSVSGPEDPKFDRLWLEIFTERTGILPWWVTMGNHEWFDDYQAEIEYFHRNSRFYMPDFFYDLTVVTDSDLELGFIFLDTSLLWYSYKGENDQMAANFKKAGYSSENKSIEKQLELVEKMLLDHDDKDYVFVIGHHYINTCPNNVTNEAFNSLNEMFIQHEITAYVFGHHHSLQSVQKDGIVFIQSGAGGQNEGLCEGIEGWGAEEFGFTHLQVTRKHSIFTFVTSNGTVLHSEVAKPRRKGLRRDLKIFNVQNDDIRDAL